MTAAHAPRHSRGLCVRYYILDKNGSLMMDGISNSITLEPIRTDEEIALMPTGTSFGSKLKAIDFDPFADGEISLTAPATESQKEIWLGVQMSNEANLACMLSQSFRLTGLLNLDALQAALKVLVMRHESLRTTFSGDGTTILIAKNIEFQSP
ncbi:MAG: condensation domain-containing protein, partial [Chamaesiphon sp.]|nr:condensation domain-containing protein [Chamaesiphon sp.]